MSIPELTDIHRYSRKLLAIGDRSSFYLYSVQVPGCYHTLLTDLHYHRLFSLLGFSSALVLSVYVVLLTLCATLEYTYTLHKDFPYLS